MNLIIDVGNTLLKLAVFDKNGVVSKISCRTSDFDDTLTRVSSDYPHISNCIVSTVGIFSKKQLEALQEKYEVIELTHKSKVPFDNAYATPATLGVDRIALISAAAMQYPGKDVLVIDTGSCVTYDFLTDENIYLGGAIALGLVMRYSAVNSFTASLPLLDPEAPEYFIGNTTEQSLHSGIFQGMIFEIEGFIEAYQEKYPDLTVILTGGDAQLLQKNLKKGIFANSNFLLEGLHYILELNKD